MTRRVRSDAENMHKALGVRDLFFFFFFFWGGGGGGEHTFWVRFCPNHESTARIPASAENFSERGGGGGGVHFFRARNLFDISSIGLELHENPQLLPAKKKKKSYIGKMWGHSASPPPPVSYSNGIKT